MTSGDVEVTVENGNGNSANDGPLMKKVKEAQKNSNSKCEFFNALWVVISGTVGCAVTLAVSLAVPVVLVALGAEYWNYCPAEECIPYWLMSWGSTWIVRQLIAIAIYRLTAEQRQRNKWLSCVHVLDVILFLGFIAGSYFVYHIFLPDFEMDYSQEYCHAGMYLFTFVVLTTIYALLFIVLLLICCGCAATRVEE